MEEMEEMGIGQNRDFAANSNCAIPQISKAPPPPIFAVVDRISDSKHPTYLARRSFGHSASGGSLCSHQRLSISRMKIGGQRRLKACYFKSTVHNTDEA